jgi:nucleobase transporter 1/2
MLPFHGAVTTVIVGFQHYLVMLGTTVIIATILVPLMGGGHVSSLPLPLHLCHTVMSFSALHTLARGIARRRRRRW